MKPSTPASRTRSWPARRCATYAAATYRGTHTTYRWVGGAAGSWQRTAVKDSGVVSAAKAQRYGGWTGVTNLLLAPFGVIGWVWTGLPA